MAYMSKKHAKEIKTNLKKAYPDFKFSVTKDSISIRVSILQSPLDFSKDLSESSYSYIQVNEFYPERYSNAETLKNILNIINEKNFDDSDIMSDYFNVGFYVHFNIGDYNKPYKQIIS